ncbi:kinesin-related protein 6-like, partial [Trifolium medium]|nr:kinesin-related protein 6-like [Trifolium medium]
GIHHQRQNSDNFILDANYHGRWFQPSAFAQEFGTRSSSLRKNDDDRLFTSGLLDLHSFDTELLPEVWCLFGISLIEELLTGKL